MRTAAAGLALLAACASPDPLDDWSTAALCGEGPPVAHEALIPAPRALRPGPGDALVFAALEVAPDSLETPALARAAADVAATDRGPGAAGASLTVHALGPEAIAALEARCGLTVPAADEAYHLALSNERGAPRAVLAARTARGRSRGAALLAELAVAHPGAVPPLAVTDAPAQARRGILEGYYGPPWSPEERLEMLRFAWRARMNTLVWAPKGELLARLLWRADWSDELLIHLRQLAREGRDLDVQVCAELSPGIGILYGDAAERAIVVDKLSRLADVGVTCLVLAFDDIPRELRAEDQATFGAGGLGAAQAVLIREVFGALSARHPGVALGLVPTDYSTAAMKANPDYLAALATAVPAEAFLGWTGAEIISPTITAADVAEVARMWSHPPLVGDNYPVTDSSRLDGRLQLGPISQREPAAVIDGAGWVANTLPLPRASMLPLLTIAELTWRPHDYLAADAAARATRRVGGAHADALAFFAAHAQSSALEPREATALAALADAWLSGNDGAAAGALRDHLGRMAGIEAELAPLGPLALELAPWSAQLAAYGRAGLELLALEDAPDPARLDALRTEAARLRASTVAIGRPVTDDLLARGMER